ncbi:MAG TPA: cysteine hydrolase [Gemmatimonadaceae bacterium]|nr:cysteine hydrolase [Gemmatimonadaceae bacterium]
MKRAFGIDIPQTLEELSSAQRMALLIYDMQVGITRQVQDADVIVGKVRQVLDAARAASIRTFFTRHMSLPKALMGAFQYRMAMAWQRVDDPDRVTPWFLRGASGFGIVPELEPTADEAIFDKITMSAFEGTPLTIALRDCGSTALAIAGIAMEVGIEPTARHAADLGFVPVIITDACGAGNKAAAQRSLDSLTFAGDAIMTTTAEFCRVLG